MSATANTRPQKLQQSGYGSKKRLSPARVMCIDARRRA